MAQSKNIILAVTAAIILAGAGYFLYQSRPLTQAPAETPTAVLDQKNCTYTIEGEQVTLVDGYAVEPPATDFWPESITRYFGNELAGDFNQDGLSDVAFVLIQDPGASGTFYYAAVALGSPNGCVGTNAILLGDRIAPQSTNFVDGKIAVNYAERKPGEPMTADPSVGVSKYLRVSEGNLVQIEF